MIILAFHRRNCDSPLAIAQVNKTLEKSRTVLGIASATQMKKSTGISFEVGSIDSRKMFPNGKLSFSALLLEVGMALERF